MKYFIILQIQIPDMQVLAYLSHVTKFMLSGEPFIMAGFCDFPQCLLEYDGILL